jgi:uncharacterized protein (TIGR03437 family)
LLYLQANADGHDPVAALGVLGEYIGAPGSIPGANLSAAKPRDILYAGASPFFIGLYQINLRVADGVPSGNQAMIVKVGSAQTPTGGYLAIQ